MYDKKSVLFHFTLILLKLEHALITADLLNQNPTKKVMLLYKKCFYQMLQMVIFSECRIITDEIVMINITKPKRPFSTFSFTERQ